MASQISCPKCKTALRIPEEMYGKKVRCKACQDIFIARAPQKAPDDHRLQPKTQPKSAARPRDEEEDGRRDRRDRPRSEDAGSALPLILGGVAALMVILGGVGTGIWIFVSGSQPVVTPNPAPPPPQNIGRNQFGGGMAQANTPRLRYRWQGAPLAYAVSVEIDHDKLTEIHEGSCVLTAKQSDRHSNPFWDGKGTGTGFVVNSDGILITCHHVIANARKIEVALGGKTYLGTVVDSDEKNDLAVVKIEAQKLQTLSLGDSDTAKVGLEVRALGFPLSSVLGDNIKQTRGTIAGINTRNSRKTIQVDAAINQGNSGGPLVTETGLVIGVNNSKLSGYTISNVGFATPSNDVKKLLTSKGLTFHTDGWEKKLEGTVLVERVASATALFTVSTGPEREVDAYTVTCSGSLARRDKLKEAVLQAPAPPATPPNRRTVSKIEVDFTGNILEISTGPQLPSLLGDMGQFIIEPIPEDQRESWEDVRVCTIEESTTGLSLFNPRLPRFRTATPAPPRDNTKQRQANEKSRYTRGPTEDNVVKISKQYELKAEPIAGSDGIILNGDSQITFDRKGGFIRTVEFKGTMTRSNGMTQKTETIVASYKLLEGEARDKLVNPQKAPPPKPVTEAELPELIAEAKAKKGPAVERLATATPVASKRAEVVATLMELAHEQDLSVREAAAKALATWGEKDKDSALELVKLVDDSTPSVRAAAIEGLAKLKDERGIEPIAKRLNDSSTRKEAATALMVYGQKAEKAILGVLDGTDWAARSEACSLLKEVGTAASKAALEKATGDKNPLVAKYAKDALAAIAARK